MKKISNKLSNNSNDLDKEVDDFYVLLSEAKKEQDIHSIHTTITPKNQNAHSLEHSLHSQEDHFLVPEYEGELSVDVFDTGKEIVIQSPIAGVKSSDLEVLVSDDMVTIRGKRMQVKDNDHVEYLFSECYWGDFSRTIMLPSEIDTRKISAKLVDGILTIRLPKIKREKIISVEVKEK